MPVRIYDIAKKLGLESKEVLSKAKELGIAAARVPSSSLDKITAEYLETHLGVTQPEAHAPSAPASHHPIIIVADPTPEPVVETAEPVAEPEQAPAEHFEVEPAPIAADEPPAQDVQAAPPEPVNQPVEEASPAPAPNVPTSPPLSTSSPVAAEPPPAPIPAAPPKPATPGLGDKVGSIQLPPRPGSRIGDKVGSVRLAAPVARGTSQRQDFGRPGGGRPGMQTRGAFGQRGGPGQRGGGGSEPSRNAPESPKFATSPSAEVITIKPPIVVRELAEQLRVKPFKLIADLMELGVFATVNQAIDETVAQRVCAKNGFRFEVEKRERGGGIVHAPERKVELDVDDKAEDMKPRAPVVTIMGHVDHGKTTLLDVIRKSDVAGGESGGITQHIGAYTISFPHPERKDELQQITFLDTPGHAAFSAMRARGANVTDIVILVVAANDGVMPQTLEALNHAQAAKVPIIVAVNKMDHPAANSMRVRQQLQEKGLVPDDWGGDTIFVEVSAMTKLGVDKLLELILLQADLLELKANPNRRAKGNVVESGLEPGGPTATVLVRKGTLRVGDVVICGQFYGRVRALINEDGKRLKEAAPSTAVKLLGLNGVPEAGIEFSSVENEKLARDLAEKRGEEAKREGQESGPKVSLENLFAKLGERDNKTLRLVVKADTQGSAEAIVEALQKIESDKVAVEIIRDAVGTITESDVLLASASKAVILGFHTRIDNGVSEVAKREGVQIKLYAIIYELVDQVKEAMAGLLDPILKEVVVGVAEVRKVFELSKGGNVAGCVISSGRIVRGKVRVMRRKGLLYEGLIQSLRRFQDEVNEVRSGMECGIRIDGFNDYLIGDTIEYYTVEKHAGKL